MQHWHVLQFNSRTLSTFALCFLLYLITQIHQWKQWEVGIQEDASGNGIRI